MKKELELKLVAKYPTLYQDYRGDPCKTCLAWGFECGDGWYKILDDLSAKITKLIDKAPNKDCRASQVKEKFGTLRFYVNNYRDDISDVIDEAEELSGKTCEECGEPGKMRYGGWISCRCEKHSKL